MNIQTSLMAWYDFEEDYNLGHDIYDSSGRGNHIPTSGTMADPFTLESWPIRGMRRVVGKNGYGIAPNHMCYHKDREDAAGTIIYPDFRLGNASFTICAWSFMEPVAGPIPQLLILKPLEYMILLRNGTQSDFRRFHSGPPAVASQVVKNVPADNLVKNTWAFIACWYDAVAATLNFQINGGAVNSAVATVTNYNSTYPVCLGWDPSAVVGPGITFLSFDSVRTDGLQLWKRVLTADERLWLYNQGLGRTWADVVPPPTGVECEAVACCTPVSNYVASAASDSEAGSLFQTECEQDAAVEFDPPCGSSVVFPIQVKLTSNYQTAVIRYTVDDTEPNLSSTIYTGPITVTDTVTTIRARAYPTDCPEGEVFQCSWAQYNQPMIFQVYCSLFTDTVGQWGQWAPNGHDDLYFWFEFNPTANVDVQRFEVYQLDTLLTWSTGGAWSTDSPIYPPPPWVQTTPFQVYPLMFNEIGSGVIHTAYQTTFGTIAAGAHQYVLTAEPITPTLYGIFKIIMVLTDGTKVYAYAPYSTCDVCPTPPCGTEPPPCPFPVLDGLTPGCEQVTVDFTVTAPNRNYQVWMQAEGSETSAIVATGNGSGPLQEIITGLDDNTRYFFWIAQELTEVIYDHCEDWTLSSSLDSVTFNHSTVVMSASSTLVTSGSAITLSVTTTNIPAGGTVTVTSVPVVAGTPWVVTPNTLDTDNFVITADTVFTVTIVGGCTTPTATVTVLVKVPATCDTAWALAHPFLLVSKIDPGGIPRLPAQMWAPCFNASDPYYTCTPATVGVHAEWDGHLALPGVPGCSGGICCCYNTAYQGPPGGDIYQFWMATALIGITLCLEPASLYGGPGGTDWWIMTVGCPRWSDPTGAQPIWVGFKDNGDTPQGTYLSLFSAGEPMCDTQTDSVDVNPDP